MLLHRGEAHRIAAGEGGHGVLARHRPHDDSRRVASASVDARSVATWSLDVARAQNYYNHLLWLGARYRSLPPLDRRVILETNGRRWHDDATDDEHDNEKWSVPGRCGYRIVFATWGRSTATPRS